MTDKEWNLKSFTQKTLKRLSNWDNWDAAFDEQLNGHHESGAFGEPICCSSVPKNERRSILRIQWSNIMKVSGKRKAWACLNGSERAAPWLCQGGQTYAFSVDLSCM